MPFDIAPISTSFKLLLVDHDGLVYIMKEEWVYKGERPLLKIL